MKSLKSKKKKLALTCITMSVEKYGWAIQLICMDLPRFIFTISHTRENSKMFNVTSKYFSFFDNTLPASLVTHITRDFLTYYSCLKISRKCQNSMDL